MDLNARTQAIDTQKSFIVQAPAGSGKTELLTQRFLALIPTIIEPEQIVALTFTRKAALEMAHRIMQALKDAHHQIPLQNEHQKTTRQLAENALQHANSLGWQILENPQRLKIKTFDSFCMEIYKAIPKEEFATLSELQIDPHGIYQKAVEKWFEFCRTNEDYHQALKCLIRQVNNQLGSLFKQLKELLYTRDQWLPALQNNKHKSIDEHLNVISELVMQHWNNWDMLLPSFLKEDLISLIHDFHAYVPEKFPELKNIQALHELNFTQIQALQKLLLTGSGTPRKALDHHVGVYKIKSQESAYVALKSKSEDFLAHLTSHPDFINKLNLLPMLPNPENVTIDWEILQAYYQLLPILVAHLHLEFDEKESMDYIHVAQQAIYALRHSDVNLYFDSHLQHLLIDEFQDTSRVQLQLIEELTQEWTSDEPKTLFVVGDPMQSIYRFRSADVAIFLDVQQNGLGHIHLTSLHLCQNFRSNSHLILHFNAKFSEIFPPKEQVALGGVTFHPAHPVIPENSECFVQAHYYENTQQQTQAIMDILHEAQSQGATRVAILVRTRSKLPEILQSLASLKLNYSGVDLFPLHERLYIRDLWNLAQIFLEPGHRVNELAVLRSPLCGLTLDELEKIASLSPKISIFESIHQFEIDNDRLSYFLKIYQQTWRQRHQKSLSKLILDMAERLSFFKTLTPFELDEVLLFLSILEQQCHQSIWPSIQDIQEKLKNTFVSSSGSLEIQVMTIHKSKGLEFDWVILPDMGCTSRNTDKSLFKWLHTENGRDCLIIPDIPHPNIQLIDWVNVQQEQHELQRLCYVAFTRAKKRLYCLDGQKKSSKGSLRGLFPDDYFQQGQMILKNSITKLAPKTQKRLHLEHYIQPEKIFSQPTWLPGEAFQNHAQQKLMGTISHRLLQWICEFHPQETNEIPWHIAKQQFIFNGYSNTACEKAFLEIEKIIIQFLKNPIGHWICQAREFEKNEFPILIQDGEIIRHMVLDRIFIENQRLWIIDFKTQKDHEKYRIQLNRYAKALQQLYPNYPITCGLYFLTTNEWKTWEPIVFEETMPE